MWPPIKFSPNSRMATNRAGRFLAGILGINVDYRQEPEDTFRSAAKSISSVDTFVENEPTVAEWVSDRRPTVNDTKRYIKSLFPFSSWIFHYNLQWMLGDIIAGVTVGFVVVPQGMAYALLARLPAEYGLYTSFVGFLFYWIFATSKDITIGAVAVMSTIVGNVVIKVQDVNPDIPAEQIARGLSVICGAFLLFVGLIRCGWIVEFIPLVTITSFMTGAAISITVGQVPAMMGIRGVNTREAAYKVIINTLKNLPNSQLDAALGLSALFLLYGVRWFCGFMSNRQPNRRKMWFFISTLRMAFIILLYTMISWLVNRNIPDEKEAKFRILGTVPKGFRHAGVPHMDQRLVKSFASDIPASIIVLIIEHIAISKSFGRINNYVINPSQELVAIGFTNLFGPFLGGYPATGSFSRTAIKAKAGVRTPLAGVFTALIVLLALYALTSVFFYIPMSTLAGLIIHAVGDLITPPNVVYQFWEISPLEAIIFFSGVLVTVFTQIENGIYATIAASAAVLLFRTAKAKGNFLGRVSVYRVTPDNFPRRGDGHACKEDPGWSVRDAFIPMEHQDGSNPLIDAQSPYPGIFVYRFNEGFNYPNQARYLDTLTAHIFKETRRTQLERYDKIGDRPWNDPGPRNGEQININDNRPILRAVILDFSAVNNVDVTSIQGLIDIRNQLDRYAAPEIVEWHFSSINNRWTKRALSAAGFGYPSSGSIESLGHWKPIFSVAALSGAEADSITTHKASESSEIDGVDEIEPYGNRGTGRKELIRIPRRIANVHGINRPFFHMDVQAAVENAILNAEHKNATLVSTLEDKDPAKE
ncbi:Sulfate permease 2 [Coccidioides posadasii str. Silveira]|nr:sulfate permease, putative [Coccidioides posadasii C735 delta SOWgp]EER23757.1 sulfate permease, putative [Coccidioides posadasii C735 delta SOWgp]KMM65229.1 sulfate permease 2 [Coccidioides posadasii RMSCC 3488]QVM07195.1 Sulfate permease 2 [Coccidioides posadasii str. Silveira]|eukprot:XP_003065902.1 sulfate permease, putative [Coccidioides posadasii C735 delta SOWgp]